MANPTNSLSNRIGFFKGISNEIRLVGKLLADPRVHPLLKLLPIGALIYLVVPTDLMPLIPLDDAAVVTIGGYLFIELCPQDVVREIRQQILNSGSAESMPQEEDATTVQGDVIDAEFHEEQDPPDSRQN